MSMHSKWIRNNLVFYDDQRWLDAIGANVVKVKEEFQYGNWAVAAGDATGINREGWLLTFVEVGAGGQLMSLVGGADGGELLITTAGNEDDGINMQVVGEAFNPSLTTDYPFYFGIRFKVSDVTQSDWVAGLCITDTTLTAGMSDGVYFRSADGATAVSAVIEKNTTETTGTAQAVPVNDTFYVYEILFDGSNVDFYVDGTVITRLAMTNFPNDEYLTPSFEYLNGAAGSDTINIDWIRAFQIQN